MSFLRIMVLMRLATASCQQYRAGDCAARRWIDAFRVGFALAIDRKVARRVLSKSRHGERRDCRLSFGLVWIRRRSAGDEH